MVVLDKQERIICALAGRPFDDTTWDDDMQAVYNTINTLPLRFGGADVLPAGNGGRKDNRRGNYESFNFGVSYGGGQKVGCIAFLAYHR